MKFRALSPEIQGRRSSKYKDRSFFLVILQNFTFQQDGTSVLLNITSSIHISFVIQPHAVPRGTIQSYTVPHSTTQHHTVPHSTTQHHTVPHSTTQHHTIPHSTTQHHTPSYNLTQHHTTLQSITYNM